MKYKAVKNFWHDGGEYRKGNEYELEKQVADSMGKRVLPVTTEVKAIEKSPKNKMVDEPKAKKKQD